MAAKRRMGATLWPGVRGSGNDGGDRGALPGEGGEGGGEGVDSDGGGGDDEGRVCDGEGDGDDEGCVGGGGGEGVGGEGEGGGGNGLRRLATTTTEATTAAAAASPSRIAASKQRRCRMAGFALTLWGSSHSELNCSTGIWGSRARAMFTGGKHRTPLEVLPPADRILVQARQLSVDGYRTDSSTLVSLSSLYSKLSARARTRCSL